VPSFATELAQLLNGVQRPGDFCAVGTCDVFAPGLEVEGIGPIALPLLPIQAEQLIAVAKRAPFGRGEQTLVDTDVRRTWQIDAGRVRIHGRGWAGSLTGIVKRVAGGLGVTGPIAAELYKLLVYDEGSFFVSHRDTEKTDEMFATLVVVLPSNYTGGELLVRHRDREVVFDLHCPDPSQAAFAAFYADCVHEVLPVTSGCRLTLIYTLSRQEPGDRPRPPSYATEAGQLTALLRHWGEDENRTDGRPDKLIFPLEHAYSQASLSFDAARAPKLSFVGIMEPTLRASQSARPDFRETTAPAVINTPPPKYPELTAVGINIRGRYRSRTEGSEAAVEELPFEVHRALFVPVNSIL
jgi:hypothetical protein